MSHTTQRLARNKALESVRRLVRPLRPWCERLLMLIAITLAYARLRAEVGNWQALLAAAGTPLAVVDGHWSGRFLARLVRQRLPGPIVQRLPWPAAPAGPPVMWAPQASNDIPTGGLATTAHDQLSPRPPVASSPMPPFPVAGDVGMPAPLVGRSQHCVLFAVDIAQFTAAGRDDEVQLALREALYRLLIASFGHAGIPWSACVHEDRGDGVIVVIPTHMPTITVVDPLIEQIRVGLRRHNRLASPVAQVHLRLAVHIGEVYRDDHGLAGKAVNHVFRMLDAPVLRQALCRSETGMALIVSDYVYQSVIHGGLGDADRAVYSEVTVRVKQFEARAWLREGPGAR